MKQPFDLQRELPDYCLEPFPLVEGAYWYSDRTPAHSFTTVISPVSNDPFFLALRARDYFDDRFAASMLEFVRDRWDSVNLSQPMLIIEGFKYPGYNFNSLVVLNPVCGNAFENENATLSSRTFVIFPIHRCEFSGDETCELIDLIRHDFVSTLDWKRRISPQIYVRFHNTLTGARSTGKKMGLASADFLFEQLHELSSDKSSFIEVNNYKKEFCRFTRKDDNFVVTLSTSQQTINIPPDQIDRWITSYLTKGTPSCVP
jgi:hypothetical protein